MNAPVQDLSSPPASVGVRQFLQITRDLTQLVEKESGLLMRKRPSDLGAFEAEKRRLSTAYAKAVAALRVNKDALRAMTGEDKAALKEAIETFEAALKAHGRLVLRLKTVSEGIVRAVGREVEKRNRPVSSYQGNAQMRPPPTGAAPTSISLDQHA